MLHPSLQGVTEAAQLWQNVLSQDDTTTLHACYGGPMERGSLGTIHACTKLRHTACVKHLCHCHKLALGSTLAHPKKIFNCRHSHVVWHMPLHIAHGHWNLHQHPMWLPGTLCGHHPRVYKLITLHFSTRVHHHLLIGYTISLLCGYKLRLCILAASH